MRMTGSIFVKFKYKILKLKKRKEDSIRFFYVCEWLAWPGIDNILALRETFQDCIK